MMTKGYNTMPRVTGHRFHLQSLSHWQYFSQKFCPKTHRQVSSQRWPGWSHGTKLWTWLDVFSRRTCTLLQRTDHRLNIQCALTHNAYCRHWPYCSAQTIDSTFSEHSPTWHSAFYRSTVQSMHPSIIVVNTESRKTLASPPNDHVTRFIFRCQQVNAVVPLTLVGKESYWSFQICCIHSSINIYVNQ